MLASPARLSVRQWKIVVAMAAIYVAYGIHSFRTIPIEAFPDVTDPMVEIVAVYPGQSAEDIERRVTVEIERVVAGTPRLTNLRSVSVFGLALVTLRFEDGSGDFQNRAQVAERLHEAHLPDGVDAVMGPQATPVGQIFRYTLHGPRELRELRSLQDWVIERRLRSVPGVADVVTFGGFERQYAVRIDPVRLANIGVSVGQIFTALDQTNANAGGGYVGIGSQDFIVRGIGTMRSAADIGSALVANDGLVPIRIQDVADVVDSSRPRRGSVGRGQDDEVIEGIVLLRKGENAKDVLEALQTRIDELNTGVLPGDVRIVPFYDRRHLIATTVSTVGHNLLHGAILVIAVVLLFLRSFKGALIIGAVIPISLLTSFVGLKLLGRPANLISLGAVDFGILVENAAVVLEVTLHTLAAVQVAGLVSRKKKASAIVESVRSLTRPIGFATLIIVVGLVPLFMLERVEGRIFAPMAYTLVFAMVGALVAAITVVPALMFSVLPAKVHADEARWFAWMQRRYRIVLGAVRTKRGMVVAGAIVAVAALALYARDIGTEFLPELNEGGLYITAVFPSTVALDETRRQVPDMRRRMLELPETLDVLSHIGRPEDATQTEGPNNVEFFVALRPMEEWRHGVTRHDLEAELRRSLREIPGVDYNFSQPITDRVFETVSGIIGQIVVKVRGNDLAVLTNLAGEIKRRLEKVHGVADLSLYQAGDVPQLGIDLDRERLARQGLTVADVQKVVEVALGGKVATELWDGERRYGVALRLPDRVRQDREALGRLVIGDAERRVTLAEVATIKPAQGRSAIWREDLSRFVAVKFNIRGADMGSVVRDARAAIANLERPEGVQITWGGEFENQQRAMQRLAVVVPLTLLAMIAILFANFRRWAPTLLIIGLLPAALLAAVAFLKLSGNNFSVSAAVGCVILLGQVTLCGVLVCSRIDEQALANVADPIRTGVETALRPIFLTVSLAALGLVPAALSMGMGAESQRPFAITIIGGLLATLPLVLILLPVLYTPAKPVRYSGDAADESGIGPVPKTVVALVALMLTFGNSAQAQAADDPRPPAPARVSAGQLDADIVLRQWLTASPEVAAWRAQIGASRFDVVTAGLLPNPQIEVTGSRPVVGQGPDGRLNFGATLTIPVPVFGQRGARRSAAEARLSAVEAEVAVQIWERAAAIRTALLELTFLREEGRLAQTQVGELESLSRIAESRSAAGVEPRYDGMRIATTTAAARAQLHRREAETEQARGQVLALVATTEFGRPEPTLDGLGRLGFRPASQDQMIERALEQRPDLLVARRSARTAEAQIEQFRREALPIPSLIAGTYVTRELNSVSAIAGLSIPLPLFDRNQGLIGRARVEANGYQSQKTALEARVRAEVSAAFAARDRARTALDDLRRGPLEQATDLLARARRAYQAGVFGITELLEAHDSVWTLREQLLAVEKTAFEAEAQLFRALGGLAE
ncbi:MAG TPA: CusA/CzcA family heavy metal efflux RND transporter [Polyangia bacterium]|nr:CusA/CzcA family heavy metal efflux RND transporter [Polyangia bacterium]